MPGSIEQLAGKMATRYVLKQASTRKEMDGIMHVIWAANYNPYDPFAQLLFPVLGFLPSDYETAIAESQERFWNNHLSDASSHWLYVEEVRTGKPVGCAQWEVHLRNPFSDGPPSVRAPWWPKGEHRQFCELILNQVYKTRASWMVRPHLGKSYLLLVLAQTNISHFVRSSTLASCTTSKLATANRLDLAISSEHYSFYCHHEEFS
jgi:hypothetical protein